jgi:hypothetical protein
MFSDAPLPAFVGPQRAAAAVGSLYDDAPEASAAPSAAAMPPPRPVTKQKETKFIGFGGISAQYDDVYVDPFFVSSAFARHCACLHARPFPVLVLVLGCVG